jgi:hypothetical protein
MHIFVVFRSALINRIYVEVEQLYVEVEQLYVQVEQS